VQEKAQARGSHQELGSGQETKKGGQTAPNEATSPQSRAKGQDQSNRTTNQAKRRKIQPEPIRYEQSPLTITKLEPNKQQSSLLQFPEKVGSAGKPTADQEPGQGVQGPARSRADRERQKS